MTRVLYNPFSIAPGTEGHFYLQFVRVFANVSNHAFRRDIINIIIEIGRSWNPARLPAHITLALNLVVAPTDAALMRIVNSCHCNMCRVYRLTHELLQ